MSGTILRRRDRTARPPRVEHYSSAVNSEPGAHGAETLERLAVRMADRLESRGPDASATWVSPAAGIALGHRRLSIIDLSAAGRQPMVSASGRSVIAYNGEVYNFADIRRDLEAENRRFRGGSDTEVVLEACEAWGVERAVSKFIGMFAFAFWDVHARRLTLVRDRLGIKPLYWGRSGGVLFFGSQPKAVNRLSILTPNRRAKLTPLSGTAEVVPVVNRGDPRGFV